MFPPILFLERIAYFFTSILTAIGLPLLKLTHHLGPLPIKYQFQVIRNFTISFILQFR